MTPDGRPTPVPTTADHAAVAPVRVLVVEDDHEARAALRMLLELHGHAVSEAAVGDRGVAVALAHRPDVAVIDIGLPGLSGYEVARRIREGLGGAPMLLVALTGHHEVEDQGPPGETGFDAYLVKPVELTRLYALLERVRGATSSPPS